MSLRTFNRQFKQETGMTPARYVTECRVDVARRLLEESKAFKCFCTKEELDAERERAQKELSPYVLIISKIPIAPYTYASASAGE